MNATASLAQAVAALPPVALDELNAAAALLGRTDRKYFVPRHLVGPLVAALDGVRALRIDGRRSFGYDSVYFDTPDLSTYRAHLQRRRLRYKVRTRSYLDSGDCLLEVKLKGSRGATVKQRLRYEFADRDQLTAHGLGFVHRTLRDAYGLAAPPLRPVLRTSYRRTTLLAPDGASRLTCDTDLLCLGGGRAVPGLSDHVLLEVKSAAATAPPDRVLHRMGLRPAVVSKYCVAVAMLHPAMRSNPWRRAVRLCF
ncbi:MAG: polyphosphate polymerase domain-containing protein [Micromonosporaceae bacterium]